MKKFLTYRNYDLKIAKEHNAYPCFVGKYTYRMILPFYDIKGVRVAFQARDIKLKQISMLPYFNPKFDFKRHLYWIHKHTKKWVFLVEGIFDQWRFGSGALATLGKGISSYQISLLLKKGITDIYIGWDSDAFELSISTGDKIKALFDSVKVLELPEGKDPDNLTRGKLFKLMGAAIKL